MRRHYLSLFLLVLLLQAAAGQTSTTATISGTVTDPQGSRIRAATVTLIEVATNQERVAVTDIEGRYSFYAARPSRFKVRIEAPGFRTVEALVEAEVTKVVNISLELGEILIVQPIVAGVQAQLQTADASVGGVFGAESLKRLPARMRQANALFTLQPAATATGEFAGAHQDQSTVTIDGVDVSDNVRGEQGRTVIPAPLESIQEFRGIVANANATFGRSSGGQFVLVTRSGGNEFHGSSYFYGKGATDYIGSAHGYVSSLQQFDLDACAAWAKGQTFSLSIFCLLPDGARAPIFTNLQVQDLWMRTSIAESNYHAAFVSLRKRYSHGLAFDLNYTFSRSLDNVPGLTQNDLTPFQSSFYPDIDYGPSLFDINHLFKSSGVYALPFGQRGIAWAPATRRSTR